MLALVISYIGTLEKVDSIWRVGVQKTLYEKPAELVFLTQEEKKLTQWLTVEELGEEMD